MAPRSVDHLSDPDGNGIEALYELPEEVSVDDVNAALNYFDPVPLDGDESLEDRTENPVSSRS